jgi:hypothetical protein
LKVYQILAIPLLLYGCKIWTLKQRGIRRLHTKIKFMGCTVGYSLLHHQRNEDILECKVDPIKNKLA